MKQIKDKEGKNVSKKKDIFKEKIPEESGSLSDDESYHSDLHTDISLSGNLSATSDIEKPVQPRSSCEMKVHFKNVV